MPIKAFRLDIQALDIYNFELVSIYNAFSPSTLPYLFNQLYVVDSQITSRAMPYHKCHEHLPSCQVIVQQVKCLGILDCGQYKLKNRMHPQL